jgi:hypothetical protein
MAPDVNSLMITQISPRSLTLAPSASGSARTNLHEDDESFVPGRVQSSERRKPRALDTNRISSSTEEMPLLHLHHCLTLLRSRPEVPEASETLRRRIIELEVAVEEAKEALLFSICMLYEKNVRLDPCGHVFCLTCASGFETCPACRGILQDKQYLHL